MSDKTKDHVTISPATMVDGDRLMEFIQPFVEDRRLIERTPDELEQLVKTGFIAEIDQKLVGFAALEVYSRKLAEIRSLAVSPIYQGLGIGKLLVAKCVEMARERKILEVMAITSSEEFFRGCGFDFTLPRERKALFLETHQDPELVDDSVHAERNSST